MIDKLYEVVQVFNELVPCSPDLAKVKWIDCEILFKIYFYVYVCKYMLHVCVWSWRGHKRVLNPWDLGVISCELSTLSHGFSRKAGTAEPTLQLHTLCF